MTARRETSVKTMQLRRVRRAVSAGGCAPPVQIEVLQQAYTVLTWDPDADTESAVCIGSRTEWRDVPLVEEG